MKELIQIGRDGSFRGYPQNLLERLQAFGLLRKLAGGILLGPDALFHEIVARAFELTGHDSARPAGCRIEWLRDQVQPGLGIAGRGRIGNVVLNDLESAIVGLNGAGRGQQRTDQVAHTDRIP